MDGMTRLAPARRLLHLGIRDLDRTLRWKALAWTAAALLVVALGAPSSHAQGQEDLELARRARQLSGQIMSPFCLNRTLADCPSPDAAVQRDRIRTWMESGLTDDEIRSNLEREFGRVMASRGLEPTLSPVPRGTSVWLLPTLLLVGGSLLLALVLSRVQRGKVTSVDVSGDRMRMLERELDAELEAKGIGGHPPRA